MSKRRRHHKKHHGMRGFGALGASTPKGSFLVLLPVLVGGGLTAISIVAARYFTTPAPGASFTPTTKNVYRYAPAIGLAVGAIASIAMYALTRGMAGAIGTFGSSVVTAGLAFAQDKVMTGDANAAAVAVAAMTDMPAATSGVGSIYQVRTGAVVPSLGPGGTGAVVLTPQGVRGPYVGGERVSLQGINPRAFGTPAVSN